MKIGKKYWKWIRLILALAVFLPVVLVFAGEGIFLRISDWAKTLLQIQLAPAMMKSIAATSTAALWIVILLSVFTYFFGRFYCSVICPFGTFQELLSMIPFRKCREEKDHKYLRYFIFGIIFGLMVNTWNVGFLLLDPYSLFGRMVRSFSIFSLLIFVVIVILVLWKKRIFCTSVCPVGTLLGIIAVKSVRPLHFTENCVRCGKCVKVCPAGCMDPGKGVIDNERCLRCLNCISVCPAEGVGFGKQLPVPTDDERRNFLKYTLTAAGGMVIGRFLSGYMSSSGVKYAFPATGVLPPGAGNLKRFFSKCTACQLCTACCPEKIIVPGRGGAGPVSIDFTKGSCSFDCRKCIEVCPAGALRSLTLPEKQHCQIARAELAPQYCIVFQEEESCGLCADVCPVKAITLRKNGTPRPVDASLCIGCGACHKVCPAHPVAMRMKEIPRQNIRVALKITK